MRKRDRKDGGWIKLASKLIRTESIPYGTKTNRKEIIIQAISLSFSKGETSFPGSQPKDSKNDTKRGHFHRCGDSLHEMGNIKT